MISAVKHAAEGGAASGGLLGLGTSLMGGASVRKALRNAAASALLAGGVSGAGVGVGTAALGEPHEEDEDDPNPYTRRGAVGGAIAGGGAGALLGAALAKGYLRAPAELGALNKLAGKHPLLGALAGGTVGALAGGYKAGDEGMQVDFLQHELDAHHKRRMRKARGI